MSESAFESVEQCPACEETLPPESGTCPHCGEALFESELRDRLHRPRRLAETAFQDTRPVFAGSLSAVMAAQAALGARGYETFIQDEWMKVMNPFATGGSCLGGMLRAPANQAVEVMAEIAADQAPPEFEEPISERDRQIEALRDLGWRIRWSAVNWFLAPLGFLFAVFYFRERRTLEGRPPGHTLTILSLAALCHRYCLRDFPVLPKSLLFLRTMVVFLSRESTPLLNRRPRTRELFRSRSIKLHDLLFAVAALSWIPGCVSTVTPPENPADPVTVYLAASACHAGVVLPHPEGGMVEYAFGDWDWYALNCDRWYHAFDTVLWPTQGALGRRRLKTRNRTGLAASFPGDLLRPFPASRERTESLIKELEERFRRHSGKLVYNKRFGLSFVPDERGYWFLANCNDEAAGWLRKLGCSVSWVPIRLGLTLDSR